MKQTRHSLMAKGIMVLLSLLVLIFAFTFSWFKTAEPEADATGMFFKAHGTADFEYAIGFKTESTYNNYVHTAFTNAQTAELNLKSLTVGANSYDLLEDYNPIDITGDGVTLVRPAMNYGNWSVNGATRNYSIAEPNVDYISFDLIVRAKSPCTVSLDADSFAKGACETYAGDYSKLVSRSSGVSNQSTYSKNSGTYSNYFSKDAIVGATRVAFVGYDNSDDASFDADKLQNEEQTTYNTSPELLWVTRPDLYLDNDPSGTENPNISYNQELAMADWALQTGVTPSKTFNLACVARGGVDSPVTGYSTYVHEYYNIFEVSSEQSPDYVVDNAATTKASSIDPTSHEVTFGQTSSIMNVNLLEDANNNGEHDADEYYYGKVRVRIWIEGSDSESRRALAGGKFSINFDLTTH